MMLSQILDGLDKEERQLIYLRYFQERHRQQWGDSGDFTGSGVENGKENTGADEKADVSRL